MSPSSSCRRYCAHAAVVSLCCIAMSAAAFGLDGIHSLARPGRLGARGATASSMALGRRSSRALLATANLCTYADGSCYENDDFITSLGMPSTDSQRMLAYFFVQMQTCMKIKSESACTGNCIWDSEGQVCYLNYYMDLMWLRDKGFCSGSPMDSAAVCRQLHNATACSASGSGAGGGGGITGPQCFWEARPATSYTPTLLPYGVANLAINSALAILGYDTTPDKAGGACLPRWLKDDSALVATISAKYMAYVGGAAVAAASNAATTAGIVDVVSADLLGSCAGLDRFRRLLLSCPSHTSSATCRAFGDGCYWDSYGKICDSQNFGIALLLDPADAWVKAFDDANGLCQAKTSRAACASAGKITIDTSLYSNPDYIAAAVPSFASGGGGTNGGGAVVVGSSPPPPDSSPPPPPPLKPSPPPPHSPPPSHPPGPPPAKPPGPPTTPDSPDPFPPSPPPPSPLPPSPLLDVSPSIVPPMPPPPTTEDVAKQFNETAAADLASLTTGLPPALVNRYPASVLVLTRTALPVVENAKRQAVVGAARYGDGRLAAVGGEQMVTRCCTPDGSSAIGGGGDTSLSPPSSDPDLDRLLYNVVAWAADTNRSDSSRAGEPERDPTSPSAGAALLCVSDPRYLNMARLVSEQTESTSSAGNTGGGAVRRRGMVAALLDAVPLSAFLQSQLPNGASRLCDVYVIGAYDSAYSLPYVQQALVSFVWSGGGLLVAGPDVMPSAFYRRQRQEQRRRLQHESAAAASAAAGGQHSLRRLRQQPGQQSTGQDNEEAPLIDATSITVNAITGPMGLTFSGYISDPGGNLTLASGPSLLSNAELAASAYVGYLQGQVTLSPPDLHFALNTITRARTTLPRGSASSTYGSGADAFWQLSDAAAVLAAGGMLSPPSPPPPSPPPPSASWRPPPPHPSPSPSSLPPPSPRNLSYVVPGLRSWTAVGCLAEIPTNRVLPYRVLANDRKNNMDMCVAITSMLLTDSYRVSVYGFTLTFDQEFQFAPRTGPVFTFLVGVSGTQCWYGPYRNASQPPPELPASQQLDDARCSTVCPGAPAELCGGPQSTVNGTAAVLMSVVRIQLQMPVRPLPPPAGEVGKSSPPHQQHHPSSSPSTGGSGHGGGGGGSGRRPPPPGRDRENGRGSSSSSSAAPPPRMFVKLRPGTVVRPVVHQQQQRDRRAATEQQQEAQLAQQTVAH